MYPLPSFFISILLTHIFKAGKIPAPFFFVFKELTSLVPIDSCHLNRADSKSPVSSGEHLQF